MERTPVRLDDISALGTELGDEELAGLAGGMLPGDGGRAAVSSVSTHINGSKDLDQDF